MRVIEQVHHAQGATLRGRRVGAWLAARSLILAAEKFSFRSDATSCMLRPTSSSHQLSPTESEVAMKTLVVPAAVFALLVVTLPFRAAVKPEAVDEYPHHGQDHRDAPLLQRLYIGC